MTQNHRILEAILFAATEPMSVQSLYERMDDGIDMAVLLKDLQDHYSERGIHLIERDGLWAFRTAEDLAEHLAMETEESKKLSRAAMETLAIIAYHQPITRAEIENIRGVSTSRGTLDVLIESGWIKPGRRRESPGRPLTWVSTSTFLDQFSLENLSDLPGLDDLKESGMLDKRPAIHAIPDTEDLFQNDNDRDTNEETSIDEKIII
jgi:segregation and condensation protein B